MIFYFRKTIYIQRGSGEERDPGTGCHASEMGGCVPPTGPGSHSEEVQRWLASAEGGGEEEEAVRPNMRRRVFFAADSQGVASPLGGEEEEWGLVSKARARRRDERRNMMEQRVQDYKDMVNRKTTEELLMEVRDKRKGVERQIDELVQLEMMEGGRTLEEEQNELDMYREVTGEEAAKRLGFRLSEKRRKRVMEREGLLEPKEEKKIEEATKDLEDMLVLHPEVEDELVKELEGEDSDAEPMCTVVAANEEEEWNLDASTVKNRIETWEVVDPATIDLEVLAEKEEEAAKGLYAGKSRSACRRKSHAKKMRCAANNIGQPTSRAREGVVDLEEEAYWKEHYEKERYELMRKKIEMNLKDRERRDKRKEEERKKKEEERKKEEDMARRFEVRGPEERSIDNRDLWLGERKMQIALEEADKRARDELMVSILMEEREMLDDLFDKFLLTKNITHYKQWTEELKEEWYGIKEEVERPRREREKAVEQLKKDHLELIEELDERQSFAAGGSGAVKGGDEELTLFI